MAESALARAGIATRTAELAATVGLGATTRAAGAAAVMVGPAAIATRALAGPGVRFLGWKSDDEIREQYQQAAAVLLPGTEDFGMVPVEAQACGTPVVALGEGGALETVVPGVTGVLAEGPTVEAFADALDQCRRTTFDPEAIRANAVRFARERFLEDFPAVVNQALRDHGPGPAMERAS